MSDPVESTHSLIERLTAERDKAREDAGVAKHRAAGYNEEMYRYLKKVMEQDALLERAWDDGFTACAHQHMEQDNNPKHPITRNNPHSK